MPCKHVDDCERRVRMSEAAKPGPCRAMRRGGRGAVGATFEKSKACPRLLSATHVNAAFNLSCVEFVRNKRVDFVRNKTSIRPSKLQNCPGARTGVLRVVLGLQNRQI